ncbi:MAG: hypothetical protein M5R41_18765 [Bacteroidia bacterium]|nr:hypothetical protein [Bacteroidia bacterium]
MDESRRKERDTRRSDGPGGDGKQEADGSASLEQVSSVLVSVFEKWRDEEDFRACYKFIASAMLSLDPVAVVEKVRATYAYGAIDPLFLNDRYLDECARFPAERRA